MDSSHYFAAVWSPGSTRWTLLCRCAGVAERADQVEAWRVKREPGASVLLGFCDAGVGVAKLDKELRRMPGPASASYSFFVERLARRLCRSFVPAFHFDVVGDELRLRSELFASETRH